MIAFNTDKQELFNHIIHNFLEIEVFSFEDGLEEIIYVLPEHLHREQPKKCKQIFNELYKWTSNTDKFWREMTAFHEAALYYFLLYMSDLQDDNDDFDEIYFDKKAKKLIKEASLEDYKKFNEMSVQEHMDCYYDIYSYSDYLFEDTDFLELDKLYNELSIGRTYLADQLGINVDYYFELLPMDIQQKYKSEHINLSGEISEFLNFVGDRTNHGSLSKMFWKNQRPIDSKKIQLIFDNLISSYYHNHDIEILWDSKIHDNFIDFEIYKVRNVEEKYLIEFMKAGPYLKQDFEQYLLDHSWLYKTTFYIIICFTDDEYESTINFIRSYVYTDTIRLYVNVRVLDMRKKTTASQSKGGKKSE